MGVAGLRRFDFIFFIGVRGSLYISFFLFLYIHANISFLISPGAVVGSWVAVVFRRSLRGSRPPPHLRVRAANGVTPELPVE